MGQGKGMSVLVQPFVGCAYQMLRGCVDPATKNVQWQCGVCHLRNASKHGGQPMREQGCRSAGLMPQHLCCHSSTQKVPPIEIRWRRDSSSSNRKRFIEWLVPPHAAEKVLPKMNAPDDLELTRNGAS